MDVKKIMKILCGSLLLLLSIMEAEAQTIMNGKVTVSNLAVSRTEDKLFVSMDIDVSALELKSNREVVFTPSLVGEEDSLRLSSVVIAGRNRYYYHLRNGFSSDDMTLYRCGEASVIEYRTVIPYEKWMSTAMLTMEEGECGCQCEVLMENGELLTSLNLEPEKFRPEFVYIPPKAEIKMREEKGSAYIDFPVNRTEIHENYRNNPAELQKIKSTIDAVRNDPDMWITAIHIKGYASPEGSYANNTRLAKGRTETLMKYVQGLYDFADTLLSTAYEPEDWAGLARYVESSDLTNRQSILELIRSNMDADVKENKIKLAYPTDYRFLLKNVYPGLRHSDYTVEYVVRPYTNVDEIRSLLATTPQKLSLQEMFLVTREMEPGSEEFNEVFEIAVRMYPTDSTANLNAANTAMAMGDLKKAERYLRKAGNMAESVYARGVYAALAGDYDAAEKFFVEAGEKGIVKAETMLKQIEKLKNESSQKQPQHDNNKANETLE